MTNEPSVGDRQNAEAVLEDKVSRADDRIKGYKILLRVIPWGSLTAEEESHLWRLFVPHEF